MSQKYDPKKLEKIAKKYKLSFDVLMQILIDVDKAVIANPERGLTLRAPDQGQPCPRCKGEKYIEVQLGEYEECDWCAGFGQVKTAPVR